MEPADLIPRAKPDDDPLEALLRRPPAPLRDNGFSQAVLAALPPRTEKPAMPIRAIVVSTGALMGAAFTLLRIGSPAAVTSDFAPLKAALVQAGASLNEPSALLAVLIATASVLFAFYFRSPRRQ